jgi:tetratricopeptide (TPR) repeat protein
LLQSSLLCLAGPPEDAEAHLKAGHAKEAEAIYSQLLQAKPDNATWLFNRGKARQALGDKPALAAAKKTLHEHGFRNLGDFMDKLGGQFESLKFAKVK